MSIEVSLSFVVAVATVVYVIITLMMWCESRKARKQKTTPYVIAFLKGTEDHKALTIVFKNIGEGCAKNVRTNVLKDYRLFRQVDDSISNCFFVKNGLSIMPPGYTLVYHLDWFSEIDFNSKDSYVELEITYNDIYGKFYSDNFRLMFNQIGQHYLTPPESYLGQIPYYLEKIEKRLGEIEKSK